MASSLGSNWQKTLIEILKFELKLERMGVKLEDIEPCYFLSGPGKFKLAKLAVETKKEDPEPAYFHHSDYKVFEDTEFVGITHLLTIARDETEKIFRVTEMGKNKELCPIIIITGMTKLLIDNPNISLAYTIKRKVIIIFNISLEKEGLVFYYQW